MSAIDLLTQPVNYNWPHRFTVRGREYEMVPGGPSTLYSRNGVDCMTIRVFGGKARDITIRDTDAVTVLSYYSNATGREYPA